MTTPLTPGQEITHRGVRYTLQDRHVTGGIPLWRAWAIEGEVLAWFVEADLLEEQSSFR